VTLIQALEVLAELDLVRFMAAVRDLALAWRGPPAQRDDPKACSTTAASWPRSATW
jgi:hypothetical protein